MDGDAEQVQIFRRVEGPTTKFSVLNGKPDDSSVQKVVHVANSTDQIKNDF
uniref:MSP domain-containing protein n=1 Tax=Steinernema glaseri TaxID=37863 RepID=A0A1I8A2F6_9BILA